MIVIDVIAFMAISILTLPLGSIVIASHQVVASICSMLYILPAAFSVAFSLMLSEKIGAQQNQVALLWSKRPFCLSLFLPSLYAVYYYFFEMSSFLYLPKTKRLFKSRPPSLSSEFCFI